MVPKRKVKLMCLSDRASGLDLLKSGLSSVDIGSVVENGIRHAQYSTELCVLSPHGSPQWTSPWKRVPAVTNGLLFKAKKSQKRCETST
jgi:hypothetical protein